MRARLARAEALVRDPFGMAADTRHVLEIGRADRRDDQETVARLDWPVERARVFGRKLRFLAFVHHEAKHRVHQREVHVFALARAFAPHERRADCAKGQGPREHVGNESAALERTVQPALVAHRRHVVTAGSMQDRRVTGPSGRNARLAVAGNRAVDDPRIDCRKGFVVEAQALHHAGTEVLRDHVGPGGEVQRELAAFRIFHVEHDALLARIEAAEIRAVAAAVGGLPERLAAAHVVAFGGFDLDDLGAEDPQAGACSRARQSRP